MAQVDAHQQETEWSCSAGTLKSVLKHYGIDVSEEEIIKAIGAREGRGAETTDIVEGARKLGFDASEGSFSSLAEAKETLKQGVPIIADIQSFNYPGKGHYIVITGFKPGKGFIVMDPNTKGKTAVPNWRVLSEEKLEEIWWDKAMAPPHKLMKRWGVMVKPKQKEKIAGERHAAGPGRFVTLKDLEPYRHQAQQLMRQWEREGPGIKYANGDMLDYFNKHPQKLKEYNERQAAKKKRKEKKAGGDLLGWKAMRRAKSESASSQDALATKIASYSKLEMFRTAWKAGGPEQKKALLKFVAKEGVKQHKIPLAVIAGGTTTAVGAGKLLEKDANDPVKEKFTLHGIPLSLEWRKGEVRKYFNHDPLKKKSTGTIDYNKKMKADYGYVRGIMDADGEELDVYLGPNRDSTKVFVLEKLRSSDASFDENKIMLGYDSKEEAKKSYLQHQGKDEMGKVREVTLEQFKKEFLSKKKKTAQAVMEEAFTDELSKIGGAGIAGGKAGAVIGGLLGAVKGSDQDAKGKTNVLRQGASGALKGALLGAFIGLGLQRGRAFPSLALK